MSPINNIIVLYFVGDEYTPHGPKTVNEKFIRYFDDFTTSKVTRK